MKCSACGAWNAEENQYCVNCGQRLARPAPAAPVPPPVEYPDAVDGTPPPRPKQPNPARTAINLSKRERRRKRAQAWRVQERFVLVLHFGTTMLIVALFFIFMWHNLRIGPVLADWMDPNKPFKTFDIVREPDDFDASLQEIAGSVYATSSGLTKWTAPILLRYEGNPGLDDIITLNQIIADFNSIEGFPGITLVESGENVRLAFPSSDRDYWAYDELFGGESEEVISYCRRWVVGGVYQSASVLITPKSESQNVRNNIILHEMTHLTGFIGHLDDEESVLHENAEARGLSGTDLLALQMIYNPDIPLGAAYETLEAYYAEADIEMFMPLWRTYIGPTGFEDAPDAEGPEPSGSDVDAE